jgi:hypothetical protein
MFRFSFIALVCFASVQLEGTDTGPLYRASLRHIECGGIGYKEGYTTLETFFATDPSFWNITPFLDVRGHLFNDGRWAANAGIGLRTQCGNRIWGINTYYDYRNAYRLDANQIGLGLESLGEDFDFRINGYLPIGKKNSNPYDPTFGSFSGNNLLVSQKYHSAMKGANAELGYHLGNSECLDLYVAAGPYYYVGEVARSTWGGKARVVGTFNDFLTIEFSDSYDRAFHNNFQGQIGINFTFGPQAKDRDCNCRSFNRRMLQSVDRQEIIVIDSGRKKTVAIDPSTGLPYFFVFVDNTSSSDGTFESPYHSFAQAQDNSSANNIIYVFPGDGTTTGMDSGIELKANQKLWGSGVSHSILTSQGEIAIPKLSSTSPTITNTNIDTEGNAITLATNNAISGFTITSALNDAIYGADPQSLDVSLCTFKNTGTFAIESAFSGNASVVLKNNQFLDNVNGVYLTFNGTSNFICSNNIFSGQTSVSSAPIEISADSNVLTANIENNVIKDNEAGSIRFGLSNVVDADIKVLNNTITNNGTGSQSSLASSVSILTNGTTGNCSILIKDNNFSGNDSNSLYLHTSGAFTNLAVTASANTMLNNGGSALVLATPSENLTVLATDNSITHCNDNGIAVIGSGSTAAGNITISNNTITDIGNASNGIVVNQDFTALNLSISNNEINRCEGTGIISYAPTGIESLTLNVSGNTISNCQNLSSNAAAGLDIEQYTNLEGSVINNTFADNTGVNLFIGSTLPTPTTCLNLSGNNSTDYLLSNPVDGTFNLSPCDVNSANVGTINSSGTITPVQSCPDAAACPP